MLARAMPEESQPLKIGTWNVNGIRARQTQLEQWIAAEQPDIVCLQEIKASQDQVPPAICEIEGYWCYWHGEKGYSGVGLHVNKTTAARRPAFDHPTFDYENRIVVVKLPSATVASVYVPNGGKDFEAKMRFLASLEEFAAEQHSASVPLVICGDLNIARTDIDVHPKERKPTIIGQLPSEREQLERIIGHGLVDVGRALEPDNDQMFTWWAPWRNMRQRNIGWRLDYVLASEALYARVRSCVVQKDFGTSDHAPVVAEFSMPVPIAVDIQPGSQQEHDEQPPVRRQPSLFFSAAPSFLSSSPSL
jgi:exodeoxyribonuclease-3